MRVPAINPELAPAVRGSEVNLLVEFEQAVFPKVKLIKVHSWGSGCDGMECPAMLVEEVLCLLIPLRKQHLERENGFPEQFVLEYLTDNCS